MPQPPPLATATAIATIEYSESPKESSEGEIPICDGGCEYFSYIWHGEEPYARWDDVMDVCSPPSCPEGFSCAEPFRDPEYVGDSIVVECVYVP